MIGSARILALASLLLAGAAPPTLGPRIAPPVVQEVARQAVQPAVVDDPAALPPTLTIAPDRIRAMTSLVLQPYTVEAEEWGDMPALGLSVQDMTGWGNQWSGGKQAFWSPQEPKAFKYDFSAVAGMLVIVNLTAAPDYADLQVKLGCYRKVNDVQYQYLGQMLKGYEGFASQVTRRRVIFAVANHPQCRNADSYRLVFSVMPSPPGRVYGGIDSIVVTRNMQIPPGS